MAEVVNLRLARKARARAATNAAAAANRAAFGAPKADKAFAAAEAVRRAALLDQAKREP